MTGSPALGASAGLGPAPPDAGSARRSGARSEPAPGLWAWWVWLIVVAAVIGASAWFVHWSYLRPSYDPFGWLAWGRVIIRGARLDLNAAPSWKPLPFLFTLPFSLFGGASVAMWSVTATAGTLFMGVFAGRSVYRLTGAGLGSSRRVRAAAWIGSLFAAVGVLGMEGIPQLTYIANSDQLNIALILAAVDAHLGRRHRLAYGLLFFASLGRPEAWVILGAYGLWLAWRVPGNRAFVLSGWALTLLAWFVPDAIWARSILRAGQLDLGKPKECHITKLVCVPSRLADLYEWPMQLAVLIGVGFGIVRRDRRILWLVGYAVLWLVVEIAFAYHGFSAVPRYLMEAAAVLIVVAGWGVFTLLAAGSAGSASGGARSAGVAGGRLRALAGPLLVAGIVIALVPFAAHRVDRLRIGYSTAHAWGIINRSLTTAVDRVGGRSAILRCGEVTALNKFQSQLAWATGLNVADVYYTPGLLFAVHRDIVYFKQVGFGWTVHAYNVPADRAKGCARTMDVTVS